jgi:hypothetical protein
MRKDADDSSVGLPNMQRGMCSHVIVFPQTPEMVAKKLPPSIEDIVTPVCVLFIGLTPPT